MASSTANAQAKPRAPYVTLEDHYLPPISAIKTTLESTKDFFPPPVYHKLRDLSANGPRISEMKESGIALQVVSHAPSDLADPPTVPEVCTSNSELASGIETAKLSKNLRGFARLPMQDPKAAAEELRRCVNELGFLGALVDNTLTSPSPETQSVFYDHASFDAVWAACSELNVPFYLHPSYAPVGPELSQYRFEPSAGGSFSPVVSKALSAFAFGWHIDTALHFLRLYSAGVFDRFPKLKFVLGHMGEGLPFFLERTAPIFGMIQPDKKRSLTEVWNDNVWITTSGFWGKAPLSAALQVTRPERILFSVDWPFGNNEKGVSYMDWLWSSGLVTPEQWEGIAFRNALTLFGLDESELQHVE